MIELTILRITPYIHINELVLSYQASNFGIIVNIRSLQVRKLVLY